MRMTWIIVAIVVAIAVVLGGLYWFATGGIPQRAEKPGWLTARPFAHRGLHIDGPARPENSLAAFRSAIETGYPIELDVHLTADGRVVVFHDDDLARMTGDPREIADVTYAEISELKLLGGEEAIPTLREVLDSVDGRAPVLVEIKNRGEVGPLEEAVAAELVRYPGDVAVMSFNPYSLAYLADRLPDLPRGQLSGPLADEDLAFYERFALSRLLMNWKSRPDFVAYDLEALPTLGTWLQRVRGRTLLAWTAENPTEAAKGRRWADNVICNPGGLERR